MKKIKIFKDYCKETVFLVEDILAFIFILVENLIKGHFFAASISKENSKRELYILGNGPSLEETLHSRIERANVDICAVNFSMLTDLYVQLKPQMHVFADPAFFYRTDFPKMPELYAFIREKIDWNITICVPYGVPDTFRNVCGSNSHITLVEITGVVWKCKSRFMHFLKFFLYKNNIVHPCFQNVVVAAIYAAINMGYKNIRLFGVEHSWLNVMYVNSNNQVCLRDEHYYGTEDKVWKDGDGNPIKISNLLIFLSKMFDGYDELQAYSQYLGDVQIRNCTPNSFIDSFERE